MPPNDIDRLVAAAAQFLQRQHGEDAVLEARIGKRHAEIMGDQAAVEAFSAILNYLELHEKDKAGERHVAWKSTEDASSRD